MPEKGATTVKTTTTAGTGNRRFILKGTQRYCWLATPRKPVPLRFMDRSECEQYRKHFPADAPYILVAMSTPVAYKIARLRFKAATQKGRNS